MRDTSHKIFEKKNSHRILVVELRIMIKVKFSKIIQTIKIRRSREWKRKECFSTEHDGRTRSRRKLKTNTDPNWNNIFQNLEFLSVITGFRSLSLSFSLNKTKKIDYLAKFYEVYFLMTGKLIISKDKMNDKRRKA